MAALILSMDFITPFDWQLPGREVEGVRGEEGYRGRLGELVRGRQGEGWIKTWGFHHYFHGTLDRKVGNFLCSKNADDQ